MLGRNAHSRFAVEYITNLEISFLMMLQIGKAVFCTTIRISRGSKRVILEREGGTA